MAVLHRVHAPRREASPVADAIHLVDDGRGHVAGEEEVSVQGMRAPAVHRARRGHQRLSDHLPAEDALSAQVAGLPAEEVHFERLEIELGDQRVECGVHPPMVARLLTAGDF